MAKKPELIEEPKEVEVEEIVDEKAPVEHVSERPREEGEKDTFHEEVKPQFKNNTENGIKIRLSEKMGNDVEWITVKPGRSVTIPEKLALANGLEKVE